jgi:inosine-uridine nucleoside N-ribohydrolase
VLRARATRENEPLPAEVTIPPFAAPFISGRVRAFWSDNRFELGACAMPMHRKLIIDTDPGIDDAVAILLALAAAQELEVLGIVAVAGNLPLAETERNARRVCELAGRSDIAVYAGCARPLLRPLATAAAIHSDMFGDKLGLPAPRMPLQRQHGVDFIIDTLREAAPGSVTLAALGPLTNIALALVKAPEIVAGIAEIVIMGGAGFEIGNITPAAEFNIHVDPHAAALVLEAGVPVTLIPLDVTHRVLATPTRVSALRALPNRCGPAAAALLDRFEAARTNRFGALGSALHDPCVTAYLLMSDLFRGRRVNVMVETASPLTSGMTVVDWWAVTGRPANAVFMTEVDAERLFQLMTEKLAHLP